MLPQSKILWHKDYFELKAMKDKLEKQINFSFVKGIYIYKGNFHLQRCHPPVPGRITLNLNA